jgi:hypothetical protein
VALSCVVYGRVMATRVRILSALLATLVASPLFTAGASASGIGKGVSIIEYGGGTTADRIANVTRLQQANASLVRINVKWSNVQPTNAAIDTSSTSYFYKYNDFVTKANAAGIQVLATISSVPCWAKDATQTDCRVPDPTLLGTFVNFMATQWGTKVTAYQPLNEIDSSVNWPTTLNGVNYHQGVLKLKAILTSVRARARQANPTALVVTPGITWNTSAATGKPADWLRDLETQQQATGVKFYDGFAFHAYPCCGQSLSTYLQNLSTARDAYYTGGGTPTQLWVTEFGTSTCTHLVTGCMSQTGQASFFATGQAAFAATTSSTIAQGGIQKVVAYETNDHYSGGLTFTQNQATKEYNFGLYDVTGVAKPARNTWAAWPG